MDSDQILLALIGAGASFTTFCLMRFPQTRRLRFQPYGPFSFTASCFGAFTILFAAAVMVYLQARWN
ncbi:MAG: hypothetical protein H8K03_01795 [Nitrospira sp.]|jgi:hypothetical protein|nr:hypothetical protein [Nitrospira sp. BO4]